MQKVKSNIVYILLGSNLGNRILYLARAKQKIENSSITIKIVSRIYETEPWGVCNQPAYLNQVLKVETVLSPLDLLTELLNIEVKLDRKREGIMDARTIDIDILFFNKIILNDTNLIIPHPRLHLRKFVLLPLNEIAPNFVHPIYKQSIHLLLKNCKDLLNVRKFC
jgi:2-amino-4-hydroxy-6-hydroxymethyldihydropteridine diphosphokinase